MSNYGDFRGEKEVLNMYKIIQKLKKSKVAFCFTK